MIPKSLLIQFAIAAIATTSYVYAESSTTTSFSVIHAPNSLLASGTHRGNKMAVQLEGNEQLYILDNTKSADQLIYTGSVPLDPEQRYKYIVVDSNGKQIHSEPFYRRLEMSNAAATPYEFYGRQHTVIPQSKSLPVAKWHYKDANRDYQYKQGLDRGQIHPNNEIPTWHIQTTQADLNTLHDKVLEDLGITANITRISANHIDQFQNVKIELSGQTSRLFKKLSYSVHMDKEGSLNGYRRFKLRSCATDPSFMREKLFYDMLEASKLPAAKASYIRLFVNGEPQGLYLVADNYKNPFLKNVFGSGSDKYKHGALYQGDMQENPLAIGKLKLGANLEYLGKHSSDYIEKATNTSVYKVQETSHGNSKDELAKLVKFIEFINKMSAVNPSKAKDEKKLMQNWNKMFDVSLFLKHLAFEVLLGHGDGYMGAAHNYMLYQDPDQKGRFVWIASDLDQTMGSTLKGARTEPARTTFQKLDRYSAFEQASNRPLTKQILQIKPFMRQFIQIITDLDRAFFSSRAVTDYILYLRELIEKDVEWDSQVDTLRQDNFVNIREKFNNQLNQKVLQLPLGHDFYDRIINKDISFDSAIQGPIKGQHPSITSLFDWFKETSEYLDEFVDSVNRS